MVCIVHIGGVLDGVRAGSHRVPRAIRAIGVNRQLQAEFVRDVGRRFHLVEGESLKAGHILIAAGGPIHLDHVDMGGHLLPHHAKHFGHAIGGASRRGEQNPAGAGWPVTLNP